MVKSRIISMVRDLLFLLCSLFFLACNQQQNAEKPIHPQKPQFAGTMVCATCHQREYNLWMGSDHQLAMQEANERSVLAKFNNTSFTYNGIESHFYRKGPDFFVTTDGPDGQLHDYKIQYTFGYKPLQQYLIQFPGGRYQALSIAWDTRPAKDGGQKWFQLYPDEKITYKDALHWTGPYQNWNHQCAECHSTNLKKNYIVSEDRFETTWTEINVACEQCHGPGSIHVNWARNKSQEKDPGLPVTLMRVRSDFPVDKRTGNPALLPKPIPYNNQVEACAQCHSRRATIREPYEYGKRLADTHLPVLLDANLYYPDGQIRDEVYEYNSFLQSKMYAQGVSCTNCHDPHSTRITAPDSKICAQCHVPEKYDTPSHHHHKTASAGSDCRSCHMPVRNYMVVDARRDHSFRIPRPDVSMKIGTPNACNQCHLDRSTQWAAQSFERWYGKKEVHFGEILDGSRKSAGNFEKQLTELIESASVPAIVRATSLVELQKYLNARSFNTLAAATHDPDPVIRLASLQALRSVDSSAVVKLAFPLLKDSVRSVRISVVALLAGMPRNDLAPEQQQDFVSASKEYIEAQRINADRPEAQMNLGNFYEATGKYTEAENAYRAAMRISPSMIQPYVNLADLYRLEGADDQGENLLNQALAIEPGNAEVHHALGLLLVRQKRLNEALTHFQKSAKGDPHYSYVYAIALNSAGKSRAAIDFLKIANQQFPADREILSGIIALAREEGDEVTSEEYAAKLRRLYPD